VFGNVEKVEKTQLIGVLPELRRVFGLRSGKFRVPGHKSLIWHLRPVDESIDVIKMEQTTTLRNLWDKDSEGDPAWWRKREIQSPVENDGIFQNGDIEWWLCPKYHRVPSSNTRVYNSWIYSDVAV